MDCWPRGEERPQQCGKNSGVAEPFGIHSLNKQGATTRENRSLHTGRCLRNAKKPAAGYCRDGSVWAKDSQCHGRVRGVRTPHQWDGVHKHFAPPCAQTRWSIGKVTDLCHLLVKQETKGHTCIASSVTSHATSVFILLSWRQRPRVGRRGTYWAVARCLVPSGCIGNKVKTPSSARSPVLRITFLLLKLTLRRKQGAMRYSIHMYFKQNHVRIFTDYIPSIWFQ